MHLFPDSTLHQLEFDKVRALLMVHCRMELSRSLVESLRFHTQLRFIEQALEETNEFVQLIHQGHPPPVGCLLAMEKELKMLALPGAVLMSDEWQMVRSLALAARSLFHWFDPEKRSENPGLSYYISSLHYEQEILKLIDEVFDERGEVMDRASDELYQIRLNLSGRRQELRREFEKVIRKWKRLQYVSDVEESFLNGRRVVALYAEHKRQVRGILHGESETGRTVFIEPEETIELNNDVFSLEQEERKAVYRILQELTRSVAIHAPLLEAYYRLMGSFDFIRAKALLAIDLEAVRPKVLSTSSVRLKQARHPLLFYYNHSQKKLTVPVDITLDETTRILVISGPNAGGKTVAMKTVGLIQLMLQCGLLVPVHPDSEIGIFRQLIIHIGDTQSIEQDLSTYSSHLLHMKFLMEHANGRTMFFIDELGSGTDPHMGGAFAEVILEELLKKHARGIVTTHYLNLKVMAGQRPGITNAAMSFDEQTLQPLFRLIAGKPGSSYTFAIAERIGLDRSLIQRARILVEKGHLQLEQLLRNAEIQVQRTEEKEKTLESYLKENAKLKNQMEQYIQKEKHRREIELIRERNKFSARKLEELKMLERQLKLLAQAWRRSEEKEQVVRQIGVLLSRKHQDLMNEKQLKQEQNQWKELKKPPEPGEKVKLPNSRQSGVVREIRGKKAIVMIGSLPVTTDLNKLIVIEEIKGEQGSETGSGV